jgi:hypothetical protein
MAHIPLCSSPPLPVKNGCTKDTSGEKKFDSHHRRQPVNNRLTLGDTMDYDSVLARMAERQRRPDPHFVAGLDFGEFRRVVPRWRAGRYCAWPRLAAAGSAATHLV